MCRLDNGRAASRRTPTPLGAKLRVNARTAEVKRQVFCFRLAGGKEVDYRPINFGPMEIRSSRRSDGRNNRIRQRRCRFNSLASPERGGGTAAEGSKPRVHAAAARGSGISEERKAAEPRAGAGAPFECGVRFREWPTIRGSKVLDLPETCGD
jgi:hypothetical protein